MKYIDQVKDGLDVELASGRQIAVRTGLVPGTECIEIRSPGGELEVSILMTPEGPRLKLRALDIELQAARSLRMRCKTLDVEVEQDARLTAGGDLTERVGGNAVREVEGAARIEAGDIAIAAPNGEISMCANDDLDLKGERILLNAEAQPIPASWDDFQRRRGLGGGPEGAT